MPIHECKSNDTNSLNKWYKQCEKEGYPYVAVQHRSKYSKVEWDYLTIPKEKDINLKNNSAKIKQEILSVFEAVSNKKAKFMFSAGVGTFDNLFPDNAKRAGEMIFEILNRYINVNV